MTDPTDDIIDAEIHDGDARATSSTFSDQNVGSFDEEISLNRSKKRAKGRGLLVGLLIIVIAVGGYFAFNKFGGSSDAQKIQGKVAMSASELRDVVLARKLTVYWAGPVDGDKYSLLATSPTIAYVRYLPAGVGAADTKTLSRAVGTYTQKNAFTITQTAGRATGNVGFINADGNAVFYVKTRPTNVYMGVPKLNLQIEIYDPGVDQALGLALIHNQVRRIV